MHILRQLILLVTFDRYLSIILLLYSSLNKTIDRKQTEDKDRARRLLDDELLSIASKDYNPNRLQMRQINLNDERYTPLKQQNQSPARKEPEMSMES